MEFRKPVKGITYLCFAVVLFVAFVLVDNLTQLALTSIFGGTFIDWPYAIQVLSRMIPAGLWIILFGLAHKISITKLKLNLLKSDEKVTAKGYFIGAAFVMVAILLNSISWGGFKMLVEYKNAGPIGFVVQHIYYFCEIMIVATLVAIFQTMCETWFKKKTIPYGGIAAAITWGLAHILTQNSLMVGALAFVYGFGFGTSYLVLNRNFKLTVIFLFLMFVL